MEFLGGILDTRFLIGFAFIAALVLAGGLVWHRFGAGPLKAMAPRGRQARLAVLEVAAVDHLRRLVLIRRDNTEHLLLIGGPTDIVIEPNIPRAAAVATARDQRPSPVPDTPARPSPLDDRPGWPPPIEPPLRVARPLDPLLAPQQAEAERLEPPLRASREPVPAEPVARMTRNEAVVRPAPPVSTERFPSEFDEAEGDAPALTPPPPPPPAPVLPEHPALVAEPRRPQVQQPSLQPAPAPERRPASVPPPPPPPPVAPPVEAPAFQRAAEPRRMAARPMAAPPPPPPSPPPYPAESASEAAWMQAVSLPPSPQELDQPAARHSPAFQSTVITEAKRGQTVPPKPSQNDESNLAEMAQRLEAALRRPIKPVEPAPPPAPPVPVRAPAPAANPMARAAAYFEPPPARGSAARGQEHPPAPVLKVVPAPEKAPSLEEEMASLLGHSTGKT